MRKCDQLNSKRRSARLRYEQQKHQKLLKRLPSLLGMFAAFRERTRLKRTSAGQRRLDLFRHGVQIGIPPKMVMTLSGFPWLTERGTPLFDVQRMPVTAPRIRVRL